VTEGKEVYREVIRCHIVVSKFDLHLFSGGHHVIGGKAIQHNRDLLISRLKASIRLRACDRGSRRTD
jgi:hypothetical protein